MFKDFMNDTQVTLPSNKDATLRVSTYGIIEQDKELLLVRDGRGENGLEFPGGGVDIGESPQEALVREVKEETGYTIDEDMTIFKVSNGNFYHAQKDTYYCSVNLFFTCSLSSTVRGKQRLASEDEISEVTFFEKGMLEDKMMAVFHRDIYREYKTR